MKLPRNDLAGAAVEPERAMHPQLQEVVEDFDAALARLQRLVGATTAEGW